MNPDFFAAVATMRRLQREYFKTRSPEILQQSKAAEREVDAMIRQQLKGQGNLFEEQGK